MGGSKSHRPCVICHRSHRASAYSRRQWKYDDNNRKCNYCIYDKQQPDRQPGRDETPPNKCGEKSRDEEWKGEEGGKRSEADVIDELCDRKERGDRICVVDSTGLNTLMKASRSGHVDTVLWLLANADQLDIDARATNPNNPNHPNNASKSGATALELCAQFEGYLGGPTDPYVRIAFALTARGADPSRVLPTECSEALATRTESSPSSNRPRSRPRPRPRPRHSAKTTWWSDRGINRHLREGVVRGSGVFLRVAWEELLGERGALTLLPLELRRVVLAYLDGRLACPALPMSIRAVTVSKTQYNEKDDKVDTKAVQCALDQHIQRITHWKPLSPALDKIWARLTALAREEIARKIATNLSSRKQLLNTLPPPPPPPPHLHPTCD